MAPGDNGPLFPQRCERPSDAVQHFGDGELLFELARSTSILNYGWILASAAVEAAAEQPFLMFMREQIFRPLGMRHTGAESATEENPEHIGEPSEDAPFLTFIHDVILQPLGVAGPKSKPATPDMVTYYSRRFGTDARKG